MGITPHNPQNRICSTGCHEAYSRIRFPHNPMGVTIRLPLYKNPLIPLYKLDPRVTSAYYSPCPCPGDMFYRNLVTYSSLVRYQKTRLKSSPQHLKSNFRFRDHHPPIPLPSLYTYARLHAWPRHTNTARVAHRRLTVWRQWASSIA